jgi:hypothetical protein
MRRPRHGELQQKLNPEAYRIWLTRDAELPPLLMLGDDIEPADPVAVVEARELAALVESRITRKQMAVLLALDVCGETAAEFARAVDLSAGRVVQIRAEALRKAKTALGL